MTALGAEAIPVETRSIFTGDKVARPRVEMNMEIASDEMVVPKRRKLGD